MTKTISIRIDEGLLHAVDVTGVKRTNVEITEVIREALEAWLKCRAFSRKKYDGTVRATRVVLFLLMSLLLSLRLKYGGNKP